MKYVLLTGADLGDKQSTLSKAAEMVSNSIGMVEAVSKLYRSAPWGFNATTEFLNQALLVESDLKPEEILIEIQRIEMNLGRIRTDIQWSSRHIDIDILCAESLRLDTAQLNIPHRMLHERVFALQPLCELVPHWIHPKLKRSYGELLAKLVEFETQPQPFV